MLFLQLLVNGLITGCGYAFMAFGFGLIYGTTRIFNFAHGAVYTASAYLFYSLSSHPALNNFEAAVIAVACAAVGGVLLDELLFQPLAERDASLLVLLLISLGLYTVVVNLIALKYGSGTVVLNRNVDFVVLRSPFVFTALQCFILSTFIVLFVSLGLLMAKTRLGLLVRALRDAPELVSAIGYNPRHVRWIVFSLGSALAAVAAILNSLELGVHPNVGMNALLTAAVAVIIGGVGRFRGAAAGALILGILQSVVVWWFSAKWLDAVAFTALIAFLIYRTEGGFTVLRRAEEKAA